MEELRTKLDLLKLTMEETGMVKIGGDERMEMERDLHRVLIAKVMVSRHITPEIFDRTMKRAWRLKGSVEVENCDIVGDNLFLVNFSNKADKEWVMKNGPWCFDDKIIVFSEIRKGEQITDLNLVRTVMWFHILDLPLDWKTEAIGKKLGETVGSVKEVQVKTCSFRIQAYVDVMKPLKRVVRAMDDEGQIRNVPIQYEKLLDICYQCGRLDHIERDCREEKEKTKKGLKPYGTWLRYSSKGAWWKVKKEKKEAQRPKDKTDKEDKETDHRQRGDENQSQIAEGAKQNQINQEGVKEGPEVMTEKQKDGQKGGEGDVEYSNEGGRMLSSLASVSLKSVKGRRGRKAKVAVMEIERTEYGGNNRGLKRKL